MRGTNEGGMRNGKREAQMRTNGKREAQMRANVEMRNGKRECTSGPPYQISHYIQMTKPAASDTPLCMYICRVVVD